MPALLSLTQIFNQILSGGSIVGDLKSTQVLNLVFDPVAKALNIKIAGYNLDAVVNPTIDDDLEDGFPLGSIWINTVSKEAFISVDATNGAAVWKSITSAAGSGTVITNTTKTFAFSASKIIDFDIDVLSFVCLLLGTRLYISDPKTQQAISRNYTFSFWPNSNRTAGEVYLGFKGKNKLVYTELVNATAVASKDFTVDDIDEMTFDDPIAFLGNIVAGVPVTDIGTLFNTIKNPNSVPPQTEDNVGRIYPIDNGVVNIGGFKDQLFSDDGLKIYGRLELEDNDTFDVKLEMKAASV